MNLNIKTNFQLAVPSGTKVITNDKYITLARKFAKRGVIAVFTCLAEDINSYDLFDENIWVELTDDEITALMEL